MFSSATNVAFRISSANAMGVFGSNACCPLNVDQSSDLLGISDVTPQPYEFESAALVGLEEMYREMMREIDCATEEAARETAKSRLAAVCYQLGRIHYDRWCSTTSQSPPPSPAATPATPTAATPATPTAATPATPTAPAEDREDDGARDQAVSMFLRARSTVEDSEADGANVLTAINALNMLGLIECKDNGNGEDAMLYLTEAEYVYQTHCEVETERLSRGRCRYEGPQTSPPPPATSCTTPRELLSACPGPWRSATPAATKHPLVTARLYTLFYAVDVFKTMGRISEALTRMHFALKLQAETDVYLQSPLDWALSSAMIAQLFLEQNAYQQARHHLAAASTMMDSIIPREYGDLTETETYKQYSADIAYCWGRYGLRLLKKSKSRIAKQKTCRKSPVFFGSMFFKNFGITCEERVTMFYVNSFEEAQVLANHTLLCLSCVRQYYTLEKVPTYNAHLCLDMCDTYQTLSFFQDNPDKMGKLYKLGIVEMELAVNRINEERNINVCRRIWYQLGTIYGDMTDIRYERLKYESRNKSSCATERATKKINRYVDSAVKYYTKFIESFYVQNQMPVRIMPETYVKPVLMAHLHIARCSNKKIVTQKDVKMEVILQCKKNYQVVVDYCKNHPKTEKMMSMELKSCKNLLQGVPAKIERLKVTEEPLKIFV